MASLTVPSDLVSVQWLHNNINHPSLLLLDASWFMPILKRDGKAEWLEQTIPGAQYFDFDKTICETTSDLPHMMPSAALFEKSVRALGINNNSTLVVFDRLGIFSSPRVWWMFKSMGFNNIAVLDGGLNSWIDAGFDTAKGNPDSALKQGDFIAQYQAHLICDSGTVLTAIGDEGSQVLDARAEDRFLGKVPEPRADLRSGHMPNAKSLPFSALIDNGKMRDIEQLSALYTARLDKQQQAIFSCGSGVTACVLALGATLCGYQNLCVYDGSWTEWGASEQLPITTAERVDGY
ncbi:sulfurtransferase [Psychromonas marina]|uniref:Sulfurtransferase n=1 Tax=Psychromonas marina TaxID=88364 RepID=A0ABQ6DWI8_9GAMM|nr:sulfurtransferase [Psychromonas marina]GLS89355.1 sulfurtransferase [Psychromonas marina]